MKISNCAEFSAWKRIDYIPFLSIVPGIGRMLRSIAVRIFGAKRDETLPKPLIGRVHLWSEMKRGATLLIPIIGNNLVRRHDREVKQALVMTLKKAIEEDFAAVWAEIPKTLQTSKSFIFSIVRSAFDDKDLLPESPQIFQYLDKKLINDPEFVSEAAWVSKNILNYTPLLACNPEFFPSKILEKQPNPQSREWDLLQFTPKLMEDRAYILKVAKCKDLEIVAHITNPELKDDSAFLLELMKALTEQEHYHPRGFQKRPDNALKALEFASDTLKNDEEFMKKAIAIHPRAIRYATSELKEKLGGDDSPDYVALLYS